MSKKTAKKQKQKTKKPQQTKIPGTERLDAIPEIERQAEVYRKACAERMEQQVVELAEQDKLTELLKKHDKAEYIYEDEDGERRRAFIPTSDEKGPRAKVQKCKKPEGDTVE